MDGQWGRSPGATRRSANPYGGFNLLLTAPLKVRALIL